MAGDDLLPLIFVSAIVATQLLPWAVRRYAVKRFCEAHAFEYLGGNAPPSLPLQKLFEEKDESRQFTNVCLGSVRGIDVAVLDHRVGHGRSKLSETVYCFRCTDGAALPYLVALAGEHFRARFIDGWWMLRVDEKRLPVTVWYADVEAIIRIHTLRADVIRGV